MGGIVASPTPIVPMSSDSTSAISWRPPASILPNAAATIQPAVPPPTMRMRLTLARMGSQALNILDVRRHRRGEPLDVHAQRRDLRRGYAPQARLDLQLERIGNRAAAEQHPGPVGFLERLVVVEVDAAVRAEQVELVRERVGRRRGPRRAPEVAVT